MCGASRSKRSRTESILRPGNARSAEGWRYVLEPMIARYRERALPLWFRDDAAFATPELNELLDAEDIGCGHLVFQFAEAAMPRMLCAEILRRIDRLRRRSPSLPA
jgi:hypothetical protein